MTVYYGHPIPNYRVQIALRKIATTKQILSGLPEQPIAAAVFGTIPFRICNTLRKVYTDDTLELVRLYRVETYHKFSRLSSFNTKT